ncbi:MAG: PAS domain S-box protein [Chitinivibrionales bacterium]|nr:PAS domain S-box protein [Chitinivibrionales bacterium]
MGKDDKSSLDKTDKIKKLMSEKRALEKQLKEQKDRFNTFISHLAYGYVALNKDGIITYANRKCAQLVGYRSTRALIGRHFNDFLDKKEWERGFRNLARAVTESNSGPHRY